MAGEGIYTDALVIQRASDSWKNLPFGSCCYLVFGKMLESDTLLLTLCQVIQLVHTYTYFITFSSLPSRPDSVKICKVLNEVAEVKLFANEGKMITFTLWSLATPGVMASTDQHAHSNKGKLIWPWDRITTVNHCFTVSEYIDINKDFVFKGR
ncbi:hypothetical protein U0070_019861 [Myodes glareolus]|uniref:Uncharacterized protein n=1 Tax=Myodes glareolus TaxID=447135 RepID=A0AAW0JKQ8_MYOGA